MAIHFKISAVGKVCRNNTTSHFGIPTWKYSLSRKGRYVVWSSLMEILYRILRNRDMMEWYMEYPMESYGIKNQSYGISVFSTGFMFRSPIFWAKQNYFTSNDPHHGIYSYILHSSGKKYLNTQPGRRTPKSSIIFSWIPSVIMRLA